MSRVVFLTLFLTYLLFPSLIYASNPPQQTSPPNLSTTSSSILNWQTPSYLLFSTSPYRIQIDNDQDFSSLYRDYYTRNTHYTPTLTDGTWYWRIKAKDANGLWSNWSPGWSFILITATPTPSPENSPSPTPTAQPSPTPSFQITNIPANIESGQNFNINFTLLLPSSPNATLYLKGAFIKPGASNYFGQTYVSTWVKNSATYSLQKQISTDSSGNASGVLQIQPDTDDSGFTGEGDYTFKVARYSANGDGPTWSNESTIHITASSQPTAVPNPSAIASKIPTSTPTLQPASSPKQLSSVTRQAKSSSPQIHGIATLGANLATPTASTSSISAKVAAQSQFNWYYFLGFLTLFIGGSIFVYFARSNAL